MRHPERWLLMALLLAGSGSAQAQESASAPSPSVVAPRLDDRLRTEGPVTVTAGNAEWAQDGAMIYTGKVRLSSRNLELSGDRLELRQIKDGKYLARVTGTPATLRHSGLPESDGKVGPPVSARARSLDYDAASGLVSILGQAVLTRGDDEITAENIRYNVIERRIQAAGEGEDQVRIILQPPADEGVGGNSLP